MLDDRYLENTINLHGGLLQPILCLLVVINVSPYLPEKKFHPPFHSHLHRLWFMVPSKLLQLQLLP